MAIVGLSKTTFISEVSIFFNILMYDIICGMERLNISVNVSKYSYLHRLSKELPANAGSSYFIILLKHYSYLQPGDPGIPLI